MRARKKERGFGNTRRKASSSGFSPPAAACESPSKKVGKNNEQKKERKEKPGCHLLASARHGDAMTDTQPTGRAGVSGDDAPSSSTAIASSSPSEGGSPHSPSSRPGDVPNPATTPRLAARAACLSPQPPAPGAAGGAPATARRGGDASAVEGWGRGPGRRHHPRRTRPTTRWGRGRRRAWWRRGRGGRRGRGRLLRAAWPPRWRPRLLP